MKIIIYSAVVVALSLVEVANSKIYARCKLRPNTNADFPPSQNLTGTIWFQEDDSGSVTVSGSVSGFTMSGDGTKHGFHIHQEASETNDCNANAGHFNPNGVNHGAPDNETRHVGDLGNIIVQSDSAAVEDANQNTLVKLSGEHKVIGRSIVVHSGEDDLGLVDNDGSRATGNAGSRLACCVIEEYKLKKYTAKCELKMDPAGAQDVMGTINLVQDMRAADDAGRRTQVQGLLTGFFTNDTETKHGFHVHASPPGAGGECVPAGGHYNPEGRVHGGPTDTIRHVGDLGNIDESSGEAQVDISDDMVELFGTYTVVGRAIVVHAGEDDLGTGGDAGSMATGNAGGRLACCKIEDTTSGDDISSANHVPASPLNLVLNLAAILVLLRVTS